jgi:Cytochrome c554 and c-prime
LAANFADDEGRFPEMFRSCTLHDPRLAEAYAAGWGRLGGMLACAAGPCPSLGAVGVPKSVRVGYAGIVADSVIAQAKKYDPSLRFKPVDPAVRGAMDQLQAGGAELLVLLVQGSRAEARQIASEHPRWDVLVALDEFDEPAAYPEIVGQTMVVGTGHKGRYVGLVGVAAAPKGAGKRWQMRYELVALNERFELPESSTNPARERLKDYVVRIHQQSPSGDTFLTKYPRRSHPSQIDFPAATFVGAAACKECHPKAYAVWSQSRHSQAFETLVELGRPVVLRPAKDSAAAERIGREFDPECVKCHTTGFEYRSGYVDQKTTPRLVGNGCENCHGPASLHVAQPKDARYSNPLRLQLATAENTCRRCHDGDNDPHFDLNTAWPKIRHGRD